MPLRCFLHKMAGSKLLHLSGSQSRSRSVESSREELNRWLARESAGEPVQIASEQIDLSAELKRGLSFVRKQSREHKHKAA
jgi:hypothetical protein